MNLVLEITDKCNNNCLHCSSDSNKYGLELDLSFLKEVIAFFKPMGLFCVTLSGGEPVFHSEFKDLLEYLILNKIKVRLYTSGNYSKKELLPFYSYFYYINISVFSHKEEVHNAITGNTSSFKRAKELFIGLKKNKVNVGINLVPMHPNIPFLEESIKDFISSWKCESLNLMKLIKQGRAAINWDDLDYNIDDISTLLKDIRYTRFVKVGSSFGRDFASRNICSAGLGRKFCITCDKRVLPCETMKGCRNLFPLWDEFKDSSIIDDSRFTKRNFCRSLLEV